MSGAIRKLVGIAGWFVRFAREVDRGIAVGRGYAPVGKNVVGARHSVHARRWAARGARAAGGGGRAGGDERRGGASRGPRSAVCGSWAAGVARAGSGRSGGEAVTGPERRAGARAPDGKEERIAWLVAPGLALIAVTYGLARFAYGLFLPEMRETVDLSDATLGLIGAGSYAGYCLAVLGALVLTSRSGPRLMAVAAGSAAVGGLAAIAGAPTGGGPAPGG